MEHRWIPAAACTLAACVAQAGNLQVAPVSLEFGPADRAQALWLTNSGQQPLHAQVRIFRWTQTEDQDQLEPTQALAPSPPLVEVAPGQSQLVRIVRRPPAADGGEEAFRLIIDEIPRDASAQEAERPVPVARGAGLRLLLRYSIPVFVGTGRAGGPTEPGALPGTWVAGAPPLLLISNEGGRRMRVSQVVHEDLHGRRTVLVPGLLGYVLAGHRRRWEIPAPAGLGAGMIKARLQEAPREFPVAAVRPGP